MNKYGLRGLMVLSIITGLFSSAQASSTMLMPPPGYMAQVGHHRDKGFTCPSMPAPYTAELNFPSKYEGSGSSRDQLNTASDSRYKEMIRPITEMEKGTVKSIDKYMATGDSEALACAISWLAEWSAAHALENKSTTHTGKSMRKWALASLSGSYLRLKFSDSKPLATYPQQAASIEAWFGRVADHVVKEWNPHDGIDKINNHYYWAAWSVMATSVILNRQDLFDWSMGYYRIFASQVDKQGYLPNETKRDTLALSYHEYAITPISMVAAFGKANGIDTASAGNHALARLADLVMRGNKNPSLFQQKTGAVQNTEKLEKKSYHAWLEPYCYVEICPETTMQWLDSLRPLNNERMGGDMTAIFAK